MSDNEQNNTAQEAINPDSTSAAIPENKNAAKPKKRGQPSTRPVVHMNISLNSEHAHKVFKRAFERCGYDTYSITVVSGVKLQNVQLIEAANTIKEILMATRQEMEARIAEIKKTLEDFEMETPAYTNPREIRAKVITPQQGIFLQNIMIMDKLMEHVDALWFAGNLEVHERKDETYKWQQRLIKDGQRIKNLSQQITSGLAKNVAQQTKVVKEKIDADTEIDTESKTEINPVVTKITRKKVSGSDIAE